MKKKTFEKKLALNKKTVVNLDKLGMSSIMGGVLYETFTEDSWDGECEGTTYGGGNNGGGTNSCPPLTGTLNC